MAWSPGVGDRICLTRTPLRRQVLDAGQTLGDRPQACPHGWVAGLALAAVGTAALGLVGPSSTYLPGVALPMVLVGAGQGLAFGPLTASGIARVDRTQAGAVLIALAVLTAAALVVPAAARRRRP